MPGGIEWRADDAERDGMAGGKGNPELKLLSKLKHLASRSFAFMQRERGVC
ncbi:hypothetical protein BELL_0067g00250 [Botrytis elliptica]|uniref:Uncharacterized protein n=1 Tax=Botrytis elliptica TaxID=278938 RepID=A0A4Z1JY29_9HELO|nr:hypothetical protein BELL_0067g00250 [Botrytis elliptica]